MRFGKTISFYLVRAVLPYFLLAWIILTVILFVQQAGRYSEIFFDPNLPSSFVWQLTFALIPNVIAFTCPMAVLVGVIIGLSRMQTDNELTAIRSFGVGSLAAIVPVVVLGLILSGFSIAVNLYGVPLASKVVRQVALSSAVYKLESPIDPGVFNTEIAGFTVYVRGVDLESGQWRNVFVYNENPEEGASRLITSRSGRIDSTGNSSELVLSDAVVSTLTNANGKIGLISENIGDLRLAIKTRRDEMVNRLSDISPAIEELGIYELGKYSLEREGKERTEAEILIVRRLMLAVAPLLFSLLGATLVLRLRRSKKGSGSGIALMSLLIYFFLTFAGEQLARSGTVPVLVGGLIPIIVSIAAIAYFALTDIRFIDLGIFSSLKKGIKGIFKGRRVLRRGDILIDLTAGIRDFELGTALIRYYLLALIFLAAVFLIFTAFELWRFAGSMPNGPWLLARYILYLVPFTYLQLAPTAAMIAVLTTFTIKSRQNEVVTWMAAGQSVYRLLFPCFLLMLLLGGLNLVLQEVVAPSANRMQDQLRKTIRSRGIEPKAGGRNWVASDRAIASFIIDGTASDNEQDLVENCRFRCIIRDAMVYQFEVDKAELQSLYRISNAVWDNGRLEIKGTGFRYVFDGNIPLRSDITGQTIELNRGTFSGGMMVPSQISISDLRSLIDEADSELEKRKLRLALEKKYTTFFLPFVIALFTAPFALGLERKGRVVS
ncbi:MAG: LptF/LptG family permease, partial [Pyrinomonadaceae bacterium]